MWYLLTLLVMLGGGPTSVVAASLLDAAAPNAFPMHVGIICIPLYGHWKPLWSVGEAFTRRGHHVTYFSENPQWCEDVQRHGVGRAACITMPSRGAFSDPALFEKLSRTDNLFLTFVDLWNESFRHHELQLGDYLAVARKVHARHPFSILLSDAATFVGGSVARALDVPSVLLFPLTTMLPLGFCNRLPLMGTGWPAQMNHWQRLLNCILRSIVVGFASSLHRVNDARALYKIPPLRNGYELGGWYDTVLAPTVWGFDIPQELCPNFHTLGLLSFDEDRTPLMEEELSAFLQGCPQGAVYVNLGTLVSLHWRQAEQLARALRQLPYCAIWKLKGEQVERLLQGDLGKMKERTHIRPYFVSPLKIMKHANVVAFVSHCGDSSVHEALEAQLPVVGIPFFADQSDVCQRLEEAGVGRYVGHKHRFTSDDVSRAIRWVVQHGNQAKANMKRLLQVSRFFGGAERAVDLLESRYRNQLLGRNESLERCVIFGDVPPADAQPLRIEQLDVFLVWFVASVSLWLIFFAYTAKLSPHLGQMMRPRQAARAKKRPRFTASPRATQPEKAG
ncbi:putative UDP-glucoronosyl and UDP-glucosyl transferase [Trypanosoma rangeli]|uniref:Putative UDP-glucoronosyl and UDP-glucosyl transferase n=1 Tax=Trypanosoma rangeli TaxID=5698 RepID=A0A422MYQ6_TRYRA|nr:putative UDP-glucoronosyl and UDP-glucosyl transferase [Trypanosoma rangeli]RNE98300.1 putative UDP-glucoronosyl and UDP-glucosyl transferase [Trypanosoma rangeli]|eukprot:RNE98300.1 putative UDP-glucoronosyl and UDP-glucosyl transferase [Trypanosoma rangeli]